MPRQIRIDVAGPNVSRSPMGWARRPEILNYIIDAYAGTEPCADSARSRRVFIWQEGTEIKMGNTEAFLAHLQAKFGLILTASATSTIHSLLRELGEVAQAHKPHGPRIGAGGKFKQPEPESWVVGIAPSPEVPPNPPLMEEEHGNSQESGSKEGKA